MYRPESSEVSYRGSVRYVYKDGVPTLVCDERYKGIRGLSNVQERWLNRNMCARGSYTQESNACYSRINKMMDLDYQISNIMRQGPCDTVVGLCQSLSFNEGPYAPMLQLSCRSPQLRVPMTHTSRLSACTYMSPPSPHWTTVGNIMTVKRSTSMPGARPHSVALPYQPVQPPSRGDVSHTSLKKKYGPFQCLRHQFRRGGHKESELRQDNHRRAESLTPDTTAKPPKSMFKKKPTADSTNINNSSFKPRGIRKSISLLFSKSNRSSKSDPSILMDKTPPITKNTTIQYQHSSRRNRSYESMLESNEDKVANDPNKCCSYSDVQDPSSHAVNNMKSAATAVSVDVMLCQRSPSESSLSDSGSVSSSQTASCHGNNSHRTNDNGWKTVVGNVCRSNSKDSAIANSTLSGDGIISESKRISLTSTVSRTSDLTTTSEEFNDSSYSSFNDLQVNSSQFFYAKPRILSTVVTNLKPIKQLICNTVESANNSDISPSSDSSTETLRPLSCLHRPRYLSDKNYRSSYSAIAGDDSSDIKNLKSLKRSHSWSGCASCRSKTSITFSPELIKRQQTAHPKSTVTVTKPAHYPKLKMSYIQQSHLNSSPLLSQYSRLYSLRSATVKDQHRIADAQFNSTTTAPISPIKYTGVTCPLSVRSNQR